MSFKFRIRRIRTTQNALASATATAKPACATAEKDLLGKHATAIYVLPVKKKKDGSIPVCSGHGRCMSLREAGDQRDFMSLFSTASYSEWEAGA